MRRGEIRLVDLEPVRGAEADKQRPAIIVSNDRANATAARLGRGVVTVVPITSNISRVFPFQTSSISRLSSKRMKRYFSGSALPCWINVTRSRCSASLRS